MPPTHKEIGSNLAQIRGLIKDACFDAGRSPNEVSLIAVSKGQEFQSIKVAYDFGQREFGESYPQELITKIKQAQTFGLNDIAWHFIGAIQTNKIRSIVEAHVIHSISSLRHASSLNEKTSKLLDVFLQVNLDNNPHRQGFGPSEILEVIKEVWHYKNLSLKGLMCIAPQVPHTSPAFWFQKMADLQKEVLLKKLVPGLALSMGMSDDFIDAIKMGSNFVRIGTAIFGHRT